MLLAMSVGYFAYHIRFYEFSEEEEGIAKPLFSFEWMKGMAPLGIIIFIAIVIALIYLILKQKRQKKHGVIARPLAILPGKKQGKASAFVKIRWLIMSMSFILIIYGSKIFGHVFSNLEMPIFACPFNEDQLISASCFYLSHIRELCASSLKEIVMFVVSFLISAIILGRILCGFICPMGFYQDVLHKGRQLLHMEGITVNETLYQKLRLIKWLFLLIFLGIGMIGGDFCYICPAITLSPAFAGFRVSLYLGGFLMIVVTAVSFLKRRAFCNVCPLGYVLGLFHKLSLFRIKKNAVSCTECGACYEACPMGIKAILTTREGKDEKTIDVTSSDCLLCGECIRRCPENDALALTFAGKKIYQASRIAFMEEYYDKH